MVSSYPHKDKSFVNFDVQIYNLQSLEIPISS